MEAYPFRSGSHVGLTIRNRLEGCNPTALANLQVSVIPTPKSLRNPMTLPCKELLLSHASHDAALSLRTIYTRSNEFASTEGVATYGLVMCYALVSLPFHDEQRLTFDVGLNYGTD